MRVDRIVVEGFRCFDERTEIDFDPDLTALVGANGSGKTAAMQALLRVFGSTTAQRRLRRGDFHVRRGESATAERQLAIEVHLSFPELSQEDTVADSGVPAFFQHVCADVDGALRCRVRLDATWQDNGLDGLIDSRIDAITSFEDEPSDDNRFPLPPHERTYLQVVYVPAVRDAMSQVGALMKGRLWNAIKWSDELKGALKDGGKSLSDAFEAEQGVETIVTAMDSRWKEVHAANTDAHLGVRAIDVRLEEFIRGASFFLRPDEEGRERDVDDLSDGQRSLFYLALTAATIDVEQAASDAPDRFETADLQLPALTVVAVEEPENNLSPFYLARIVGQLQDLAVRHRVQALISSHSASVMSRIRPDQVRYFRCEAGRSAISRITLPADPEEEAKYVQEAVMRHPEMYFASFVILGEGSSEQAVLPRIGDALGIPVDRSSVAVVPLGGRHVHHLWRLLNDLGIPHATLLDLDRGRHEAGIERIRTAVRELTACRPEGAVHAGGPLSAESLEGVQPDSPEHDTVLRAWTEHLRQYGIFFCEPLDLDMSMLTAFPDEYRRLGPGQQGPRGRGDAQNTVLGSGYEERSPVTGLDYGFYRYLFLGRGKPSTHARALAVIPDDRLADHAPDEIKALLRYVKSSIEQVPDA
ncbi:MAG: AAA family ATPase [Pseudonocardiales bacterium]|nr:AAA family ATPase [Pseudonocardiales bacterium]